MHNLGRMLAEGRGFPADQAEAHAWLAVADGYFTAEEKDEAVANAEELRALASVLTPSELERSREIAKNLGARIEERRKMKPIKTDPQDSET